ncbi:MAG: hypothetical protein JSW72_00950, partial [Candidatus Bathyarchaeota archaeon]
LAFPTFAGLSDCIQSCVVSGNILESAIMNISSTCDSSIEGLKMRRPEFRFYFPPIYGIYDLGDGTIYVFGEHDEKIEDVLGHEVLHWAVQKMAGKQASLDLDNVCPELLRI